MDLIASFKDTLCHQRPFVTQIEQKNRTVLAGKQSNNGTVVDAKTPQISCSPGSAP